jgi:hypothetical protein
MLTRTATFLIVLLVAVLALGLARASAAPRIAADSPTRSQVCEPAPEVRDTTVSPCRKKANGVIIPCPSNLACIPATVSVAARTYRETYRLPNVTMLPVVRTGALFRPPRALAAA